MQCYFLKSFGWVCIEGILAYKLSERCGCWRKQSEEEMSFNIIMTCFVTYGLHVVFQPQAYH